MLNYADIIGQTRIIDHLRGMIRRDEVPHALMLCGPQGSGKMPLALAFARHLLCEHPGEDGPCEQCSSCRMTALWAHPDLHFSFPVYKAKSSEQPTSGYYMEQWRALITSNPYIDAEMWLDKIKAENQQLYIYVTESDRLQRNLALKSSQGGRRVVVMWLPERMVEATANKMLKIIEEPPSRTHFILASQHPDQLLETIQSRVQRVQLAPLDEHTIMQALVELQDVPAEKAAELAHIVQGNYTLAQKKLEAGNEEELFFELFKKIMRVCYARQTKEMRAWTTQVMDLGRERQKRMLDYFQRQVRENFVRNLHAPSLVYQTREEGKFSDRFYPFINERNVEALTNELSDAQRDIAQNVNGRMVFFDLALKITVLIRK